MRLAAALFSALLAFPCVGGKFHDLPAGGGGGITLKVKPIDKLEEAIVVEPTECKAYLAHIDKSEGTVTIQGIPPGKYDLILKFAETIVEGLTLDVPGGYEKLSKDDRKGIKGVTWISDDYFNKKRIARLGGNRDRVKLLVEQIRTKRTFQPDGTVLGDIMIRRLELTEMRKTGMVWTIKRTKWLFREERKMHDDSDPKRPELPGMRLSLIYAPKLGGIRVGDETVTLPPVDLAKLRDKLPAHFCRAHYIQKAYRDEIRKAKEQAKEDKKKDKKKKDK